MLIMEEKKCMTKHDDAWLDEDYMVDLHPDDVEVLSFDYKLASECLSGPLKNIIKDILKDEFSDNIENSGLYNLLVHIISNKLCTMQSIKNVLSYKKKNNIRKIKDIYFNNGEVQITCLT